MGDIHPDTRPRTARRTLLLALLALCISLLLAGPAGAGPLTGGFSPTIVGGGADVDGSGVVNGSDDANAFYGDTSIIDGKLDCDAWGATANDGSPGNGTIGPTDDCSLVGYDGTPDGITIEVVDGLFQVGDGPLPTVFNASDPDNPDVGDSDFAWSAIDGRVDSNGNEGIDGQDCHVGVVDSINVLSNDTPGDPNPCGFANTSNTADNGLLDFNNDQDITGVDSCSDGCFFGLDVASGKVQEVECPGFEGDPRHDVIGTSGDDTLIGTAGSDIICARGGDDTLVGAGGKDLLLGARGADVARGGGGRDVLRGGTGRDRLLGGDAGDRLFGERGNDRLNGGRGFDRGFGGAGHDTFVSCEVRHQ
jgi:Ca2+-binding RTX toxin-like protein